MLCCPDCHTLLDINKHSLTKKIKSIDEIDDSLITNIIDKLLNNEKVSDINLLIINKINKNKHYLSLSKQQKQLIQSQLSEINDLNTNFSGAFYVCKNCTFSLPIEPGTLITTIKSKNSSSSDSTIFNYIQYSNIDPYSFNYNCINKSCQSHKLTTKNPILFFKLNYIVYYKCPYCSSIWK